MSVEEEFHPPLRPPGTVPALPPQSSEVERLRAEIDRLTDEAAVEAVSRKINSLSARALMDAIRDDPAFPPEEDPALFGERALLVINRLRAEVDRLQSARSTLVALASGERQAGLTGTSVERLEHTTRAPAYELAVRMHRRARAVTSIAEVEQAIEALGEGTPEYHEALAMYLLTMARAQWRIADAARIKRDKAERRAYALAKFADRERLK